jgi:hypothetical protein
MINTTANFDQDSRFVKCKVDIFFDATPLTVTKDDYVIDFSILEESCSIYTGDLLGSPTANELTLTLLSLNNLFDPQNTTGIYYGKIKTKIPINVYLTEGDTSEDWVPMGKYFVADWNATTNTVRANIVAYDRLYDIRKLDTPRTPIAKDLTYYQAFYNLFHSLGLQDGEFVIDPALTDTIAIMYPLRTTVGDTLTKLTQASLTNCFVDRYGIIRVVKIDTIKTAVSNFTDTTNIFSIDSTSTIHKSFSKVSFKYYDTTIAPAANIANGTSIALPATLIYNVENPVYALSDIQVSDSATITALWYDPYVINININGTATATEVKVQGYNISTSMQTVTYTANDNSDNTLEIDNQYLQTLAYVDKLGLLLKQMIACDLLVYNMSARGNPALELMDVVNVTDTTHSIQGSAKIIGAEYSYDGTLRCKYTVYNMQGVSGGV